MSFPADVVNSGSIYVLILPAKKELRGWQIIFHQMCVLNRSRSESDPSATLQIDALRLPRDRKSDRAVGPADEPPAAAFKRGFLLVTAEVDWSDIRLGYVWFEFRPRVNLTRFHGVFAPNSRLRSKVTPGGSARRCRSDMVETASERRAAKTRAQRLKRVFRIDMETCRHCGGRVKIIASIEAPGSSDRSSTVWVHVPVNSH